MIVGIEKAIVTIAVIVLIVILYVASFLFCVAIMGANSKEDESLKDKEQEEYLNTWSKTHKAKDNKRNRRKNGKRKSN